MDFLLVDKVHNFKALLSFIDVNEVRKVRANAFKHIIAANRVREEHHSLFMPKVDLRCAIIADVSHPGAILLVEVDSVMGEELNHLVGALIKEQLLVLGVHWVSELVVFFDSVLVFDFDEFKLTELLRVRVILAHALDKSSLIVKAGFHLLFFEVLRQHRLTELLWFVADE